MIKRAGDIGVAIVGLVVMGIPMLLAAAAVRLTMGAPVLFRQQRAGLRGRPFTLLKLRTMSDARGADNQLLSDAERLTPVGRWLRRASLDELPQLWNILRGDMSLVGPRPLLMRYLPYYTEGEQLRHMVRPGITGWAQINGRNEATWERRLANDVWYVEHQSIWLDMRIIALTVLSVIRGEGLMVDVGESTMQDLDVERRDSMRS